MANIEELSTGTRSGYQRSIHANIYWWVIMPIYMFEGSEHILRTNPTEDDEGFFIALFAKRSKSCLPGKSNNDESWISETKNARKKILQYRLFNLYGIRVVPVGKFI